MVCGVAEEYFWAVSDSASVSGSREHASICAEALLDEEPAVVGVTELELGEPPAVGADEELGDTAGLLLAEVPGPEPAFVDDPHAVTATMRAAVVRATRSEPFRGLGRRG